MVVLLCVMYWRRWRRGSQPSPCYKHSYPYFTRKPTKCQDILRRKHGEFINLGLSGYARPRARRAHIEFRRNISSAARHISSPVGTYRHLFSSIYTLRVFDIPLTRFDMPLCASICPLRGREGLRPHKLQFMDSRFPPLARGQSHRRSAGIRGRPRPVDG